MASYDRSSCAEAAVVVEPIDAEEPPPVAMTLSFMDEKVRPTCVHHCCRRYTGPCDRTNVCSILLAAASSVVAVVGGVAACASLWHTRHHMKPLSAGGRVEPRSQASSAAVAGVQIELLAAH